MTQKERQERSKREILNAAFEEFGKKDYDHVTMDAICLRGKISKGMMYHYYSGKDELFLLCTKELFLDLKEYVEKNAEKILKKDAAEAMMEFFMIREEYFNEYPQKKNLFENALFRTPKHLAEQIRELREPLRELNRLFFKKVVTKMKLRDGLSVENAAKFVESFEYVFWTFVNHYCSDNEKIDFNSIIQASKQVMDMIIFGIAKQD